MLFRQRQGLAITKRYTRNTCLSAVMGNITKESYLTAVKDYTLAKLSSKSVSSIPPWVTDYFSEKTGSGRYKTFVIRIASNAVEPWFGSKNLELYYGNGTGPDSPGGFQIVEYSGNHYEGYGEPHGINKAIVYWPSFDDLPNGVKGNLLWWWYFRNFMIVDPFPDEVKIPVTFKDNYLKLTRNKINCSKNTNNPDFMKDKPSYRFYSEEGICNSRNIEKNSPNRELALKNCRYLLLPYPNAVPKEGGFGSPEEDQILQFYKERAIAGELYAIPYEFHKILFNKVFDLIPELNPDISLPKQIYKKQEYINTLNDSIDVLCEHIKDVVDANTMTRLNDGSLITTETILEARFPERDRLCIEGFDFRDPNQEAKFWETSNLVKVPKEHFIQWVQENSTKKNSERSLDTLVEKKSVKSLTLDLSGFKLDAVDNQAMSIVKSKFWDTKDDDPLNSNISLILPAQSTDTKFVDEIHIDINPNIPCKQRYKNMLYYYVISELTRRDNFLPFLKNNQKLGGGGLIQNLKISDLDTSAAILQSLVNKDLLDSEDSDYKFVELLIKHFQNSRDKIRSKARKIYFSPNTDERKVYEYGISLLDDPENSAKTKELLIKTGYANMEALDKDLKKRKTVIESMRLGLTSLEAEELEKIKRLWNESKIENTSPDFVLFGKKFSYKFFLTQNTDRANKQAIVLAFIMLKHRFLAALYACGKGEGVTVEFNETTIEKDGDIAWPYIFDYTPVFDSPEFCTALKCLQTKIQRDSDILNTDDEEAINWLKTLNGYVYPKIDEDKTTELLYKKINSAITKDKNKEYLVLLRTSPPVEGKNPNRVYMPVGYTPNLKAYTSGDTGMENWLKSSFLTRNSIRKQRKKKLRKLKKKKKDKKDKKDR